MSTHDFPSSLIEEPSHVNGTSVVFYSGSEGPGEPPFFNQRIILAELRLNRLRKYRLWFGLATALCLLGLPTTFVFHLPYEPAAALLFSFAGIFVVFNMKVRDAAK